MKTNLNIAYLNGAEGMIRRGAASSGGSSGGSSSGSRWTGHADAEGLKRIGWTDEDIAYYQEHGVNWNEEDDQYHKVPEDNIALYGVLTADNISTYKDRIVYLPKIDTSGVTNMSYKLYNLPLLTAIPMIDTSSATNMFAMFMYDYCLTCLPPLDTSNVTDMSYFVSDCNSISFIPTLNTSRVANMSLAFSKCYNLTVLPVSDTSKVTDMSYMCDSCTALTSIARLSFASATTLEEAFYFCGAIKSIYIQDGGNIVNTDSSFLGLNALVHLEFKGVQTSCSFKDSDYISKESLLYLINNEASQSAITITLSRQAYTRLSTDADVVAALANHPNVSLAK